MIYNTPEVLNGVIFFTGYLRGRLALLVLEQQYQVESDIGRERFTRITSMVENRIFPSEDSTPLNQLFFLASQLAEPEQVTLTVQTDVNMQNWRKLAFSPGQLSKAYKDAQVELAQTVRQAGLPLVQDFHLRDASIELESDIKNLSQNLSSPVRSEHLISRIFLDTFLSIIIFKSLIFHEIYFHDSYIRIK